MIGRADLMKWLKGVDAKLKKKMVLVAVGGTAMTLHGLKSSTIDIDFSMSSADEKEFRNALDPRFKVDIFRDGYIFSEQLPSDYVDKASEIAELKYITLKALHPVDIIITKAARLNARDEQDIMALSKRVDKSELIRRFETVVSTYAGRESDYRLHMDIILKRFF
jgi:hypothetical protein